MLRARRRPAPAASPTARAAARRASAVPARRGGGGADHRPTDASLAVLAMLEPELVAAGAAYARLLRDDVPALNRATGGAIGAAPAIQ